MNIIKEKEDSVLILKLIGRLDAATIGELKDCVRQNVNEKTVNFVIDLAEVDFVDSSGLGGLVASLRTVNKEGGEMKISTLRPDVRSIFELTRLHRLFEIFDDSSSAANSFS